MAGHRTQPASRSIKTVSAYNSEFRRRKNYPLIPTAMAVRTEVPADRTHFASGYDDDGAAWRDSHRRTRNIVDTDAKRSVMAADAAAAACVCRCRRCQARGHDDESDCQEFCHERPSSTNTYGVRH